jgi:hypothetical protein
MNELAMMSRLEIAVTVGVLCAAGLILIARFFAPRRELLVYGVGLCITATEYIASGLHHGAPAKHILFELIGTGLFGGAAVLGIQRWPALLALGWTAHAAWDLYFHYANGPMFAPAWLPWFCVGFDIFIGGYIAGWIANRRSAAERLAA